MRCWVDAICNNKTKNHYDFFCLQINKLNTEGNAKFIIHNRIDEDNTSISQNPTLVNIIRATDSLINNLPSHKEGIKVVQKNTCQIQKKVSRLKVFSKVFNINQNCSVKIKCLIILKVNIWVRKKMFLEMNEKNSLKLFFLWKTEILVFSM